MPGFKDRGAHLIGAITKLGLMGGSLLWAWSKIRGNASRVMGEVGEFGKKVAGEAVEVGSRGAEAVSSSTRRVVHSTPKALQVVKKQKEAIMGKPKKKFSFLKFLLIMGALIALAIFLLDKFLPKPYRDDELEDAWAGEDLETPEGSKSGAGGAEEEEASAGDEEEKH